MGELTRARGRRWGGRRGDARPDRGGIEHGGRRREMGTAARFIVSRASLHSWLAGEEEEDLAELQVATASSGESGIDGETRRRRAAVRVRVHMA